MAADRSGAASGVTSVTGAVLDYEDALDVYLHQKTATRSVTKVVNHFKAAGFQECEAVIRKWASRNHWPTLALTHDMQRTGRIGNAEGIAKAWHDARKALASLSDSGHGGLKDTLDVMAELSSALMLNIVGKINDVPIRTMDDLDRSAQIAERLIRTYTECTNLVATAKASLIASGEIEASVTVSDVTPATEAASEGKSSITLITEAVSRMTAGGAQAA